MDYALIEQITKDAVDHCETHSGFIDTDTIDHILLGRNFIDRIPSLRDPERGLLTRRRDIARQEINRQLRRDGSGRKLHLVKRRTRTDPARYQLVDLLVAGMARFQAMPRAAAIAAEGTVQDVARVWINLLSPLAKKMGSQGARRWKEFCIAQARVSSQNMLMALDYANNAAGIDWPEELQVRPSTLTTKTKLAAKKKRR